jgi:Nickel responsive protein SCO4226-like
VLLMVGRQHEIRTLPFCEELLQKDSKAAYDTGMREYVIEREIPGAGNFTEEQIRTASLNSLKVLGELGPQIRWLHSYVTDDKIYCVYLAPDEASIREHAKRSGIPANRISAVRKMIDPAKYH